LAPIEELAIDKPTLADEEELDRSPLAIAENNVPK
jgi:hypothetical protein